MAQGSKKVVYSALVANGAIATAKFVAGFLTGSAAMLAEGAHSVADTVNQVFLLFSINLSDNPADEEHPYGHGKERFFWAFLAAIFIFVAGAIFSIYHGFVSLLDPHPHEGAFWPSYLVLGLAFLFDGTVFVIAVREVRRRTKELGTSFKDFMFESSDVTLKTALFEDIAATLGVVVAAGGLALVQITGNAIFDGLASIVIGVILVSVAIFLGIESRDLLLGASAEPRVRQRIRAQITSFPEVESIVNLLTMQLGLHSVLVTAELQIRDDLTTDEVEQLLVRVTSTIREMVPEAKNIFLEPHPAPLELSEAPNPVHDEDS